ncbi:MAG: extracellular solute-binding protein [Phycisphaerae bacterium]|nr:extracellular solute-binding protein [Phycisphaerae bacterium]
MKALYIISTLVLAGLTVLAVATLPERRSDVPLLYRVTDLHPSRVGQMAGFEKWMVDKGYGEVDFEIDSNNSGTMKVIIQATSGVGSEIVDIYNGGQLRQYVAAGVLMDLTDFAKEYDFGPDKTYKDAREEIVVDGRQYGFPGNLTASPVTVNRALLEREDLPMPKFDWNWDEFLQWCLKVRKVDENGRVTRYAIWPFEARRLWPTNGGTIFNETMTKCTLDSPQVLEATQFYYDLMFKHKVMPTPVERASAAVEGGYGGAEMQWLGNEMVVSMVIGRWGLVPLRNFKDFKPCVALIPYKVMPMAFIDARSSGIIAGVSDSSKKIALRFLQYLADESYNRLIIEDGDALPPNPKNTRVPEFLKPAKYPDEWGAHEKYLHVAEKYGVGQEYSRFVISTTVSRTIGRSLSGVESKTRSVKDALRKMTDKINLEISNTVNRDKKLKPLYEKALTRQREIDSLKAAGKKVPLEMIDNPVIRRLREAGK